MKEVGKEGEKAKEEVRVLTSRVAELEDINKQLTRKLQQEQAAHKVSTHLQIVMCTHIQMAIVGIFDPHLSVSFECARLWFFICLLVFY